MKYYFLMFVFLATMFLMTDVYAFTDIHFNFKDNYGNTINESIVHMEIMYNNSTEEYDKYFNDVLTVSIAEGSYTFKFYLKNLGSSQYNYYAEQHINTQTSNYDIILMQVAYLRINVYDTRDNLLESANVGIDCPPNFNEQFVTNNFGSVNINYLGFGECKIYVNYNELTASEKVFVNESRIYDISLIVQEKNENNSLVFILIAVVIALLIGAFILYNGRAKDNSNGYKKNVKNNVRKVKTVSSKRDDKVSISESKEASLGSVGSDYDKIMNLLDSNEKKVVKYLIENNGNATQNKIRLYTNIPKTSLFRVIQKLESKSIIECESLGKLKKIKLKQL